MGDILVTPINVNLASASTPLVDSDKREITFCACNETYFDRYDWFKGERYLLSFRHNPDDVDLSRVENNQCMFLDGHTGYVDPDIIGAVKSAEVTDKKLLAVCKIGASTSAQDYWANADAGVIPGVSMEAIVQELEVVSPAVYEDVSDDDDSRYVKRKLKTPAKLQATKWKLLALSSVPIPAVDGAAALSKNSNQIPENVLIKCNGITGYEWMDEDVNSKIILPNMPELIVGKLESIENGDSQKIVQLTDQLRDLNRERVDLQGQIVTLSANVADLSLRLRYWQLRHNALESYAVLNQTTQDEFETDFSDDSAADIARFQALGDEAQIEFKLIERQLTQHSKRQPIDRLQTDAQKELFSNRTVVSKVALTVDGERDNTDENESPVTITKASVDTFLEKRKAKRKATSYR